MALLLCFIGGFLLGHGLVRIPMKMMFDADIDPLDLVISLGSIVFGGFLLYYGFTA